MNRNIVSGFVHPTEKRTYIKLAIKAATANSLEIAEHNMAKETAMNWFNKTTT